VDECQDLSEGNLMMLEKIQYRRAVAVGDRNQAIYAFRGALSNSLDLIKQKYAMEEFPLNTCFRCGTNIIAEARRYVPTLESPDWMWEGEVIRDECNVAQVLDFIQPGDAVVCHVNAPLVGIAVQLIKAKIGFGFKKFAGMKENINHQLESIVLKKHKQDDPFMELLAMREDKMKKLAEKDEPTDAWNDLFDCCKVLLEGTAGSIENAIRMLDEISNCTGGVLLTSGHSSKGGEWESVFLLGLKDAEQILSTGMRGTRRLSPEELQQFYNLVYVMLTRAKRLLVICD
jgi:superfamily I DNA/RNA helicase